MEEAGGAMKAIFSPGPSYTDPGPREYAGWLHILDLTRQALEDVGLEVVVPEVPKELIDRASTVSQITSWDLVAASQMPEEFDLLLGPPGYSLAQILKAREHYNTTSDFEAGHHAKVVTWVWNNSDAWRDHQLAEEYHAMKWPYDLSPTWRWVNKRALELSDLVVACSPFVKATHQALVPGANIQIAPWGVDSGRFTPDWEWLAQNPKPLKVLFVGSDVVRKGLSYLLLALEGLEGVELTLVGSLARVDVKGIKVQNLSMVPNSEMPALYRRHHAMALPTLEDGIALSVQEAMASGLVPVTSPDAAEVFSRPTPLAEAEGRIFRQEDSGFVVGYRDVEGYRRALTWLRDHPEERFAMGRRARALAETQPWDIYRKGFADIITKLLKE